MSDRVQDLTNHRKVAVACKNYTDKEIKASEERILSIVARNNVNFIDHTNEATYRFTAPANSKLLMLQSIAGNSNKIAPSTASDDTTVNLKAIPTNTYTTQVDYVGGMSYKYNQLVKDTYHNYSYSLGQWGSNFLTDVDIIENHKYLLVYKVSSFTSGNLKICFGNLSSQPNAFTKTIDENTTLNTAISSVFTANSAIAGYKASLYNLYATSAVGTIDFVNIIDMTSDFGAGNEPTSVSDARIAYLARGVNIDEYNAYSLPTIRDTKNTSIVASGNVFPNEFVSETKNGITCTKNSDGTLIFNGTTTGYPNFYGGSITLTAGTYYLPMQTSGVIVYYWIGTAINTNDIVNAQSNRTISFTLTATTTLYFSIVLVTNNTFSNVKIYPLCMKNASIISTSDYIPYAQPISKSIPAFVQALDGYGVGLSSSLYNSLNLVSKKLNAKVKYRKYVGASGENWQTNYGLFNIAVGDNKYTANVVNFICNKYTEIEYHGSLTDFINAGDKIITLTSSYIYIKDTSITSVADLKTALASLNLEIVYELATEEDIDVSEYIDDSFKSFNTNNQYTQIEMVNEYNANLPSKVEYYGTIIHSLATAVKQEGFNIWDEEWEVGELGEYGIKTSGTRVISKNFVPVLPNTQYYCSNNLFGTMYFYNSNQEFISYSSSNFTTPSNCAYIKFRMSNSYGSTYNNDICINISNQDLNGTYKSYKAPITRLLPNSEAKYSWGITDGVRNVRTYCDDEGNAVNEGSLDVDLLKFKDTNWVYYLEQTRFYFINSNFNFPSSDSSIPTDVLLNANYSWTNMYGMTHNTSANLTIAGYTNQLTIKDTNFNNATNFKNHFSNDDELYYKQKNTNTETLDDFDYFFDCEEGDTFTIIGCELLQCYATYSFLIKEARSNE